MTDAERLRQQYKTSLGREASDAEIAGWTSGQYGGGGIDQWLGQIGSSHEAQQRPTYRAPLSAQAAPGAGYSQPTTMGLPTTRTPQQQQQATASSTDPWDTFRAGSFGKSNYDWSPQSYQDVVKDAYAYFTGREADAAGLAAHLKNPGGVEGAVRSIYESPEAQAYKSANPNYWLPQAAAATAAQGTPNAVQPQIFQGFTPKYRMEGFAFDRLQDTGKSAKDAFAFLSNNAPPPPINDKAKLGEWFQQYVAPGMNQLGHKVLSVDGDKFTFENWQGRFTVDFGRGAGAAGGALAWQVDPETAQMSNGPYVPQPVAQSSSGGTAITDRSGGSAAPVTSSNPNAAVTAPETFDPMSSALYYRRRFGGYENDLGSAPQPSI